jgi:Spy/CpxP family protein refolding chaperone
MAWTPVIVSDTDAQPVAARSQDRGTTVKILGMLGSLAMIAVLSLPAAAQAPIGPPSDERLEQQGMGERGDSGRWGPHGPHGGPGGGGWRGPMRRPLISLMLHHRAELELSASQVDGLERLRGDFMREAIRREADLKIARLDLMGLLRPDSADPTKAVDTAKAEGKIREIEKMRGDLRISRLRTIEAGKALLTQEQRTKLASLMAQRRPQWQHRAPAPPAPPRS